MGFGKSWKFKNLTILTAGILLAVFFFKFEKFHPFLLNLGAFGYLGAFIAGIMYDSIFTLGTSIVILLVLAGGFPLIGIGLFAGLGAVLGDFIIFRFARNNLLGEFKLAYTTLGVGKLSFIKTIFHSKYFNWTLPVIGALFIALPLPEEIGVSLLAASHIKTRQLLFLSFILHFIGISLILFISSFIKP